MCDGNIAPLRSISTSNDDIIAPFLSILTSYIFLPPSFHNRHSLLSHSAVVARELGLPTIVGVSGGLLKRLQTGMKVRMDGAKGTVTILGQDHETEDGTE